MTNADSSQRPPFYGILSLCAALLATLFIITGCDSFGGDEYYPPATEILRVEVEPNPVAAGDTAVFTSVIKDSLEAGFVFVWFLENGLDTTRTNQYEWVAPSDLGTYIHQVRVEKPEAEVEHVQQPFEVTVIENE